MTKKITIEVEVEIIDEFEDEDILGRIFYPNEGNKIILKKGANQLAFHRNFLHEIGHLFDWYLSEGKQSKDVNIREKIADEVMYMDFPKVFGWKSAIDNIQQLYDDTSENHNMVHTTLGDAIFVKDVEQIIKNSYSK